MGLSSATILAIVQSVSIYCGLQGPGMSVEARVYEQNWVEDHKRTSVSCFKKIWSCTRNTNDAYAMNTRVFNCITQHINGELK